MCKTKSISSFADLAGFIAETKTVDVDNLNVLSNPSSTEKERQRAMKDLEKTVCVSLDHLDSSYGMYSCMKDMDYKDCCRNLAAYLLSFGSEGKYFDRAFSALVDVLEFFGAPSFRHDLREMRRKFSLERSEVESLGFMWADLKIPFDCDRFTAAFVKSSIIVLPEPKVVVVEKEIVKEVAIEKIVEKEVIREVEKIVEVGPKVDPNFFGNEDQYTEMKSSVVESYNEKPQIFNICRAVCAFLNAEGGTIYIGVHDNGMAYPKMMGTFPAGVEKDIRYLSRANRLPFGKSTVDSYCIYVRNAIEKEFRQGNDVTKFVGDIIVSQTHNDNVIKVEVRPSRYAVVRLDGKAYMRVGAECKEMNAVQIEQRTQDLLSVSKEVHFRNVLSNAMKAKKQVILYAYESTSSKSIEDRFVEPVNFVCESTSVICYDTVKLGTRQFKLSRIGDIKILDTDWKYEDKHEIGNADIFGWTNHGKSFEICLDMKLPAKAALLENHPNADKRYLTKVGDGIWRLETTVFSLDPVRSFYLGLADCIDIQESKDSELLKGNIREFVQSHIIGKL